MDENWNARPSDDEDSRRKAEIEEMMRSQRERYFRDEAVQQEYRDIVDRQLAAQEAAVAVATGSGPFDSALADFKARREKDSDDTKQQYLQLATMEWPSDVNYQDESAGDSPERFGTKAISRDLAKGYSLDLPQRNNRHEGVQ